MLIGLVGKPSAGKSTFFKAATLSEVEIASYPFTTIKANRGVGYVKIDCLDKEFVGHLILDLRNCIREYERHHAQLPLQYTRITI